MRPRARRRRCGHRHVSVLVPQILNDSHHASYKVHFKSNYAGEPDLKYCVLVYCQQGWDPKTTKTFGHEDGERAGARQGRHATRDVRAAAGA